MSSSEDDIATKILDEMKNIRRYECIPRSVTSYHNQITENQYNMHNKWAKAAFLQSSNQCVVKPVKKLAQPDLKPIYNENSPSEQDKNTLKGQINEESISKFLKSPLKTQIEGIPPISFPREINELDFLLPNVLASYFKPRDGYVTISLGSFDLIDPFQLGEVNGIIFLYDIKQFQVLSEPIYIQKVQDLLKFTQPMTDNVYIPINLISPDVQILCILYTTTPQTLGCRIPFAFAFAQIFNENNEFIKSITQFPELWNVVEKDLLKEIRKYLETKERKSVIKIKISIEIHYEPSLERQFTYSWSQNLNNNYCVTRFPPPSFTPTPISYFYNIAMKLPSQQQGEYVFFKAFFCETLDNPRSPATTPFFEGTESTAFESIYISTALMSDTKLHFADVLRIYIDHDISNNAHLVLHIFSVNAQTGISNMFGICIIPFYDGQVPLNHDRYKFPIYDPKSIPKNILKISKAGKTYIKCNVRLPAAYFPPYELNGIITPTSADQIVAPAISNINTDILARQAIEITGKILSFIAPNTAQQLMNLFDVLNKEEILPVLKTWIFNVMDPTIFEEPGKKPNFIYSLCHSFRFIITENFPIEKRDSNEDQKILNQLAFIIPIVLDILIVCISTPKFYYDPKDVISLLDCIPRIIAKSCQSKSTVVTKSPTKLPDNRKSRVSTVHLDTKIENHVSIMHAKTRPASDVNTAFANFISFFMPYVEFSQISPLLQNYFTLLNDYKKYSTNKVNFSYLQFSLLIPFSYTPHFIVNYALMCKTPSNKPNLSPYVPMISSIYLALMHSLHALDSDSIELALTFFLRISILSDELPDKIAHKIAFILLPLLDTIMKEFDSFYFQKNLRLQQYLIPILIFLFKKLEKEQIRTFFNSLGSNFQNHFISLLQKITKNVMESVIIKKPTYEKPEIELNYFDEITHHFLNFILTIIDYIEQCIPQVVELMIDLYNEYQPIDNVNLFYDVCAQIVDKYQCNRSLVKWLLELLLFENQHETRCMATALLIKVLKSDFQKNGSIVISSVDLMDSLTGVLLSIPVPKISIYKLLISQIIKITPSFQIKDFTNLVSERMKAAQIIIDVVEEQKKSVLPAEIRCQRLMRIADQYKTFPSMRLKWIFEIVRVNLEDENYVSAFLAQLHVVCLIASVLEMKKNITESKTPRSFYLSTTQPMRTALIESATTKQDFSFNKAVLVENQINIDKTTTLHEFTMEYLLENLAEAIKLGNQANQFYTLRPLFSLQTRLYYSSRSAKDLHEVFNNLAESISKIHCVNTSTYNSNLTFLLVDKQIYCNMKSATFLIEKINKEGLFEDKEVVLWKKGDEKENTIKAYVLSSVNDDDNAHEYQHSWTHFKSVIDINQYKDASDFKKNDVAYFEVTSKDPLPHYRGATDAINVKEMHTNVFDYVSQVVKESIKLLNRSAEDLESCFPMQLQSQNPNRLTKPNETVFVPTVKSVSFTLFEVFEKKETTTRAKLNVLKKQFPEESTTMAKSILEPGIRCLKALKRALAEIDPNFGKEAEFTEIKNVDPTKINEIKQTTQLVLGSVAKIENFVTEFDLKFNNEEVTPYVAYTDPLDDGIIYEE